MRVGTGFDAHAFIKGGKNIILGGAAIPHTAAIDAHSDGDVLLHALCDALLGAAACGDIGQWFPETVEYQDIDSSVFVQKTMQIITGKFWVPINVDSVIIAQAPKLQPFIGKMRKQVGMLLNLDLNCVSIKASTTDHLGFIGRNEGIAAIASVLLQQKNNHTY